MSGQNSADDTRLSAQETALYDRQIRLWGMAAQARMGKARILVVGFRGLAAEVCKNVVLAGVAHVTVLDDATVMHQHVGANFFLTVDDVGSSRASAAVKQMRLLNPMVTIDADCRAVEALPAHYVRGFTVVLCNDARLATLRTLSAQCRAHGVPLVAADTHAWAGWCLSDVDGASFAVDAPCVEKHVGIDDDGVISLGGNGAQGQGRDGEGDNGRVKEHMVTLKSPSVEHVLQHMAWTSLRCSERRGVSPLFFRVCAAMEWRAAAAHEGAGVRSFVHTLLQRKGRTKEDANALIGMDTFQEFIDTFDTELSPVCAIVGGVVAQEVLKVASGKRRPLLNFFSYNGATGVARVDALAVDA